ncbi:MAG: HAD-IIA family hydrolase [Chloroflexota bacterium]|nr:HAD-IIA family hydrolase [Chloroflexota bacterium]
MALEWNRVRAVLFDMDGVLYRGDQALPGVNELLAFLARREVAYACITNNASRTREQFSAKLQGLGIAVPPERIVTSATATSVWLRARAPRGTTIYAIGMDGLREALFADGYFVEQPPEGSRYPDYVVVGADFEVTYAKLATACLAIRAGSLFVGTNPDTTFPSERGIVPGAGALIVALEAASDRKAAIIGKPEPAMFEAALQLLGVPASDALVVGDRLDTDVLGAARAGIPSAMVLTGVSTVAELEQSTLRPDAVFAGLPELLAEWQHQDGAASMT